MCLFDSIRVLGLFLGFHDVFIVLFIVQRECSAYFYRLAVRWEDEKEFCIWGLHGFQDYLYHCLWLSCHLERDFTVLGSLYSF